MIGQISAWTFSGCAPSGCKVEAWHLPYKAEVESTTEGNGTLTLSNGGSGVPQLRFTCPGFGGSCAYGAAKIILDVEGGAPADIRAVSENLTREEAEPICGPSVKLNGAYEVSEPMALFVSSRSAPQIALCASGISPCPEGDAYPIGTELHAALSGGSASITGEFWSVPCSGSTLTGKTTGAGTPMIGQISAWTFSGCAPSGCKVEAWHLPYKAEVESTTEGNGTLTLSNGGSGVPQLRFTCPGFGGSCAYGAAKIILDVEGGAPADIRAVSENLTREEAEPICGPSIKLSGAYEALEPMALFIEAAGIHSLYFGISANTRSFEDPGEEQNYVLETGADRIREDLDWNAVEPTDGSWHWLNTDELFEAAAERGISILPVLDSPPCWAVPEEVNEEDCWQSYPVLNSKFANFTAHVAARYGPGGDFWSSHPELDGNLAPQYFEIWNEPYFPQFTNNEVNPSLYADLYKAAVVAGREANPLVRYLAESTVDVPNPTGPGWVNWAKGMVEEEPEIGKYIDGIAIHPYPGSNDPYYAPQTGTDASFQNTDLIYEDWVNLGIRRPIWITEVGYSSCSDSADCVFGDTQAARETLKGIWLSDLFSELASEKYAYVHAVYLYNLRQWLSSEEPTETASDWYGILNANSEELPGWSSFSTAVEKYAGIPLAHALIIGHAIGGGNASFTFTAGDPTASFSCQLDNGSWTTCASPEGYTGIGGGSHTFRVKGVNAEGIGSSPATYSW